MWIVIFGSHIKNLQNGHKLKEEGVRVCNDAILGNFYFKLWGCGFKKTMCFAVLRNFLVISIQFAVFLCYSVP